MQALSGPAGITVRAKDSTDLAAVDCAGSTRCVVVGSAAGRPFYGIGDLG